MTSLAGVPMIVWVTPKHSVAGSWVARTDEAPPSATTTPTSTATPTRFM